MESDYKRLFNVYSNFKNNETNNNIKVLLGIVYFYYKNFKDQLEEQAFQENIVNLKFKTSKKKKINYRNVDEYIASSVSEIGKFIRYNFNLTMTMDLINIIIFYFLIF